MHGTSWQANNVGRVSFLSHSLKSSTDTLPLKEEHTGFVFQYGVIMFTTHSLHQSNLSFEASSQNENSNWILTTHVAQQCGKLRRITTVILRPSVRKWWTTSDVCWSSCSNFTFFTQCNTTVLRGRQTAKCSAKIFNKLLWLRNMGTDMWSFSCQVEQQRIF